MAVVTPEAAVLFVDPKKLSAEVTQVKPKNKKKTHTGALLSGCMTGLVG